jgi:hypothetical protein
MSDNFQIDAALAKLEAGKFSFQMVETIRTHIARIENELQTTSRLHADAVQELQRQEYAVWRLEAEVSKLNAKIHALIKANVLSEKADRAAAIALAKMAEYFEISKKYALETARGVAADLKKGEMPAQLVQAKEKAEALRAQIFNEKTAAEIEPYVRKAAEGLEIAKKQALVMADRAAAYLSTLHKTAA